MKEFLNKLSCFSGTCGHVEHILIPFIFVSISIVSLILIKKHKNKVK